MSTYANVDGIPFTMPVRSQGSPVLFGCFSIDAGAAAELLPGPALHPCRLLRRGVLVVAVANYLATPIGPYVEFCIGILVTKGRSRAPALAPLLVRSLFGVGVYIYDLPVSTEIDLDRLLAIDAVPGVVPPVARDGTLYVDAMLLKDANVTEAVRQGADEIWIAWAVEERSEWRGGFWNHLGHIFEVCAVGNLKRELDAVDAMNNHVAAGRGAPGEKHVAVHLPRPQEPLPVSYLIFRSKKQMRATIELGRRWAGRYLAEQGTSTAAGQSAPPVRA